MLISTAAHLCMVFVFGSGRIDVAHAKHQQGSVLIIAELVKPVVPGAVNSSKLNGHHKGKVEVVADHLSLSQTKFLTGSKKPEKDTLDLETQRIHAPKEEDILFPIVRALEPYYFPANELSEMPQVKLDLSPSLAFSLHSASAQLAVLRLLINEEGQIDEIFIDDSPLSESDQRLVMETFSKSKFQPGKIDGMPVKSQLKIEVRLDDGFDNQ
ncbi:MAG: hypothetical protein Q7T66_15190 [Herminiimonas sp.]|nr:hypothetical protein [Herminiimonas sp.]MDO9422004.1 hypothetical protein [Herminiimonas sp.]